MAFPNIGILNNKLLIQALKFWILFIKNWQLYIKDHLNATKSASSTLIMNGSIIMECCMGGDPIHIKFKPDDIVMAYLPAVGADFIFSM